MFNLYRGRTSFSDQISFSLQKPHPFDNLTVITPSRVQAILYEQNIYGSSLDNSTRSEIREMLRMACRHTEADVLIAFKDIGTDTGMKNLFLPFGTRMEIKTKTKVLVFISQTNTISIFIVEIKTEMVSKGSSPEKATAMFAETVVKKLPSNFNCHRHPNKER